MKYFRVRYDEKKDSMKLEIKNGSRDKYGLDIECEFVHAAEYPLAEKEFIHGGLFKEILKLLTLGYTYDRKGTDEL